LFAAVPFAPPVVQWHQDEIVELPIGAVLLAASTRYPHQAFRIGTAAWGVQFHIECDTEMFAVWALDGVQTLLDLGLDPVETLAEVDRSMVDIAEVWQPFAARFAALALGRSAVAPDPALPRHLPLLGG
jgi:GMP synthase-like glutamine amidotransferase